MKKHTQGMILLEVLLGTVLFGIFSVSIWSAFQKVYWHYDRQNKEVIRLEEARMILSFIEEEINQAEGVIIQTTEGIDVMKSKETIDNQMLAQMTFFSSKRGTGDKQKLSLVKRQEGYELIYQSVTVAEKISGLTISREKESPLVAVMCSLVDGKGEEKATTLLISLEHKQLE